MAKKKKENTRGERGLGTVIKKDNGIFETQVTVGYDPISKKRIRETFSSSDKEEVKNKRLEFLQRRNRFNGIYDKDITLSEWIMEWLEDIKSISLAKTTYAKYNTLIKTHIIPRLGSFPLRDITQKHIQQFINTIYKEGTPRKRGEISIKGTPLSPATVVECHSILFASLDLATTPDKGLLEYNPCSHTELPKIKRRERDIFQDEDICLVLQEARKADIAAEERYKNFKKEEICCWHLAIRLLFETGLRRGELLGLRWKDVDLLTSNVKIQQSYVSLNGQGIPSQLKTKSSYRGLPTQVSTTQELKLWKEKQWQIKLRNKTLYKDQGYIFTNHIGLPIDPNWFSTKLKKLQARLGIKELSPHCTRHTVATKLLQQGVPISDVQAWGGWGSPRVLLEHYSHALPSNKNKVLSILGDLTKENEPSANTESPNH
ncbi:site-specific integrase [Pelosinus propionicus]|uniref:Phage integrase, N-terminal SAM-like domain n=1 Tax=Pelosinus propionicus DSM 13327 TaxID=1123291 RepID=A0A1I4LIV3_9FIRM|nr:site-specific integrase [Pelosinus propionicus]SFL91038.1 Phage integrase, N-terminal SAM-like domain [Pelosinus propionicus DSM 13327]